MYLRFFADTDNTVIGHVALRYLSAIVDMKVCPVRLLTTNHGVGPLFAAHMDLLSTPMQGDDYVNVVCCNPDRWVWLHKLHIPESETYPGAYPAEDVKNWMGLYSEGHRNVLITPVIANTKKQVEEAKRYEILIVDRSGPVRDWWAAIPSIIPHVIDDAHLRDAIFDPRNQ